MSGIALEKRLTTAERERMRALYASGEWLQYELAEEFGVSRSLVAALVAGVVRQEPTRYPHPISERTIPTPPGHTPLPVVRLADLVWMIRPGRAPRLWWPSVPEQCGTCGGAVYLEPPLHEPGRVLCHSCSREVVDVRL